MRRAGQVLAALTAKIEDSDRAFIKLWLGRREQNLFWAMHLADQRHALNVAYTAIRLAEEQKSFIDKEKLIRCCLLHDVGKVRGDISTLDKIIAVLMHRCAPAWSERWGVRGKGNPLKNLRHAFYIYFHHARRGRDKLLALGLTELAEIVAKHHKAPAEEDPPELTLLREADDLN